MTALKVGDMVKCARSTPSSGTWWRYAGRRGVVVVRNHQKLADGSTYVEYGVAWNPQQDLTKASADAWFLPDELEVVKGR